MAEIPALTCEVCGQEPAVGVAAVPGVPISMAYGPDCLRANAHPYGVVVANTALAGGLEQSAQWWRELINDTLTHLKVSPDQFLTDVQLAMTDLDEVDTDAPPPAPVDTVDVPEQFL